MDDAEPHEPQPPPPPSTTTATAASNTSAAAPPDLRSHAVPIAQRPPRPPHHVVNYHAPTPPNHHHQPPPPPPQPLYSNGLPPINQFGVAQHSHHAYPMSQPQHYIVAPPWNNITGPAPNNPAPAGGRWPLPPQSPSFPGHKKNQKEVKRRTKTGCLTCRKRRIKCDEGHPQCNNCRKSKRACLGYDPIFKHSASSPQPIQPAPISSHSPTAPPAGASVPTYTYNHNAPPISGHSLPNNPLGGPPPQDPNFVPSSYPPPIMPERRVQPVAMDDLFRLNNVSPPYQPRHPPPPAPATAQQEIADFYNYHYGPGLNRLLETTWYTHQGLQQLQQDPTLYDFVSQCVDQFKARTDEPMATQRIESLEARLVWHLACMPRLAAQKHEDHAPSMHDLLSRIDTLESLLNGQVLDPQRIPLAPQGGPGTSAHKEQAFWHQLGKCCAARDHTPNPEGFRVANDSLQAMRAILENMESRDVLYSIAIGRHIGGRMPDFHPQRALVAPTADPNDDINRLKVAHAFLVAEDQQGTTQVIQRICSMALRGWALQKSAPQPPSQA